jgi:hypothetical protein
MKIFFLILLLMLSINASAEVQEDIVFKSRFDLESSQNFINQLRIFLENNNFGDPYAQELKKPIVVDLAKVLDEVPQDTQNWIREFQSVVKIQLFESDYKLRIEKFGYSINDFNAEFKPGISSEQRVEYVTTNYVRGVHLKAERISFEVELKQTQSRQPIAFSVELIEPEFIVSPELMAEVSMGWSTAVMPENIFLNLESVDIRKLMARIVKSPDLIDLRVKDMVMPDVSIRIGHKEITFDKQKIKRFFINRKEDMKKGVLDLLNVKLNERFANIIKDNPKKLILPRKYGIEGDIPGVFNVEKMDVNNTGIVQFDLDGHFCNDTSTLSSDFCEDNKIPTKLRRTIDISRYQKSLREVNRGLIEKKTNMAVSVSEHYLNQVVDATIKAGLWEESFKGRDFSMGPEKSFILAEEKGPNLSMYLDIIYKLKGAQRILVGRSELRFPIKFMIELNVTEVDKIPHFSIRVVKVATEDQLLLDGAPQYGLPSSVKTVPRFRNKVLKAIHEEINTFNNQVLIEIEMKELKGTYLDELEFTSDGNGRANATIGFKK